MKRKNGNQRTVRQMDNEVRTFGYCAECGSEITDDVERYYCDEDGNLFCSHECLFEHFCITPIER